MDTETAVLALHGGVALALVGLGLVSLAAGDVIPFLLRSITGVLVAGVGYAVARTL